MTEAERMQSEILQKVSRLTALAEESSRKFDALFDYRNADKQLIDDIRVDYVPREHCLERNKHTDLIIREIRKDLDAVRQSFSRYAGIFTAIAVAAQVLLKVILK